MQKTECFKYIAAEVWNLAWPLYELALRALNNLEFYRHIYSFLMNDRQSKIVFLNSPHLLVCMMETRCFSVVNERRVFHYRPGIPLGLREVEAPIISRQLAHESSRGCSTLRPCHLYPQRISIVLIFVRGWVDSVRPEGLCQCKIPFNPGHFGLQWISTNNSAKADRFSVDYELHFYVLFGWLSRLKVFGLMIYLFVTSVIQLRSNKKLNLIYIYIYICVCVCVCVLDLIN
jgi:hypothetical protein